MTRRILGVLAAVLFAAAIVAYIVGPGWLWPWPVTG